MLSAALIVAAWGVASVLSGSAIWRLMLAAQATRFEALVAGLAGALLLTPLVAAWCLLLPGRFLGSFLLACAITALISLLVSKSGWARSRPRPPIHVGSLWPALPAAIAIGGAGLVSAYAAWIKPVWEIDALLYHGPSVANLIQHGSLFGWDSPSPWIFYPNLAAVMSAATAVGAQSLNLLDATQAPFLVLLGLVAWAWGGRGRPHGLAGAVAAIAILTPAAFVQGRAMYVDVIYAAALLTGLWLVGLWLSRNRPAYLVLGMGALGAAPALKPSGLTIAAAIFVLAVIVGVVWRRRTSTWPLLGSLASLLFAAAPFYLRNAIEFRNPLYPVSVEVFDHRFPGPADVGLFLESAAPEQLVSLPGPVGFFRNLAYGVTNLPSPIVYDSRVGAFGPITAILACVLVIGAIALLPRVLAEGWRCLLPFVWPVAALALVLGLQLQAWNPRYTLAAYALIVVIAALSVSRLHLPRRIEAMAAIGLVLVLFGTTAMAESKTMQSIRDSRAAQDRHPLFNKGVTGTNPAYGDEYAWLSGAPCGTRVVAASLEMQAGLLNAYNLPMWGDALCNEVRVVRDTRRGGGDYMRGDRQNLADAIPQADFVVAFEADRDLVVDTARKHGLRAVLVANPPDYYGADQVVFRITRAPQSRG